MFGLPNNTYFGKLVPKTKFYNKMSINKKLERSFIDQINSIRWIHKLSADTLNVEKGTSTKEIEVFLIKLKKRELNLNVLRQIDSQLYYHLIFILEFEGQYQIWTGYKEKSINTAFKVFNYYHIDWTTEELFSFRIDGLNMDTIYENIVRQIAGNELVKKNNETLKESVERKIKQEKLQKNIKKIYAKIRKEKQLNRQFELNNKLKELLWKLENI